MPNTNWICRAQWISPDLDQSVRPFTFTGDESVDGITLDWNDAYASRAKYYQEHTVSFETYLAAVDRLLTALRPIMATAIDAAAAYQHGLLTEQTYLKHMQELEPLVLDLYREAGNIGFVPVACNSLAQSFQRVVSAAHNVVLPFSERGLHTWPQRNRDYLVRSAIDSFQTEQECMRIERARLA